MLFRTIAGLICTFAGIFFPPVSPAIAACAIPIPPKLIAEQDLEKEFVRIQEQNVRLLLAQISNTIGLEDGWAKSFEKELKSDINLAAQRFKEERDPNDGTSPRRNWDQQLKAAVWEKVASEIPPEQSLFFNQLRKDADEAELAYTQSALEATVSFLDDYLCLSRKQQKLVTELFAKNWCTDWNGQAGALTMNGFRFPDEWWESLDRNGLSEILDERQNEVLEKLGSISSGRERILAFESESLSVAIPMKDVCQLLMDLKIAEYDRLCTLTERQTKFFEIAKKGAVTRVSDHWETLVEELKKDVEVRVTISRDFRMLKAISTPAMQHCVNRREWKNTLEKILDEDQLKKVVEREGERIAASRKQFASYLVFKIFSKQDKLLFTKEQQLELIHLIEEHIELEFGGDLISTMLGFCEIEDADLEAILTEAQWRILKQKMDRERELIQKLVEAQKK